MSITGSNADFERQKFVESSTRTGLAAVEVSATILSSKIFEVPSTSTCYTYTTGTDGIYYTEIYRFYLSGTPASPVTLLRTITLYYTDSSYLLEFGGVVT